MSVGGYRIRFARSVKSLVYSKSQPKACYYAFEGPFLREALCIHYMGFSLAYILCTVM